MGNFSIRKSHKGSGIISRRRMAAVVTATAFAAAIPSSSFAAPADEPINDFESRIVGGTTAGNGAYPFMTSVTISKSGGTYSCGGTLVSKDIVLTAQHCTNGSQNITVRVGSNQRNSGGQTRKAARVVAGGGVQNGDWAVLKLDKAVSGITPITLAGKESDNNLSTLRAIGWGATSQGGAGSNSLLQVDVPKTPDAQCNKNNLEICAGEQGKDSCQGDSGGPLLAKHNKWVQVGVTSWGSGCASAGLPGHYTRVSTFLPDIQKAIKNVGGTAATSTGSGGPSKPVGDTPGGPQLPGFPGADEPGTDEPGTDEPGADEPGTDEPGTDEPGADEPGTDEPGADEPGTDEPGTDEPGADEPGAGDEQDNRPWWSFIFGGW